METRVSAIEQTISDLQASQDDIKESLRRTCDIRKLTDNTAEAIDALDKAVTNLEMQTAEQSCTLQEVNKVTVQLLKKVSDFTNKLKGTTAVTRQVADVTYDNRTVNKIDEHISTSTERRQRTQTYSQTLVVQRASVNVSSLKHLQGQTGNGSKEKHHRITWETDGYTIPSKPQICEPTDKKQAYGIYESTREKFVNEIDDDNFDVVKLKQMQSQNKPSDSQDLLLEREDRAAQLLSKDNDRNDQLHGQHQLSQVKSDDRTYATKKNQKVLSNADDNQKTTSNKSTIIHDNNYYCERARRNHYGYKQIQCDIKSDNRVSFHNKTPCFQGAASASGEEIASEFQDEPNIECSDQSSDSLLAEALSKEIEATSDFLNSPTFDQPKTIADWFSFADQIRVNALIKRQTGAVKRGARGHEYVLVLDCSARMKGQKFDTMIKAVKTYINGIKVVSMNVNLHDNIGLAIFGEISYLISEPTCDYNMLLHQIDQLKPRGEAPLVGGLLMGLAGVLGSGKTSIIGEYEIQGFAILFTDSQSENTSTANELGLNPSYKFFDPSRDAFRLAEAQGAITKMVDSGIKVYYVPVEDNTQNQIMAMALQHTNGKIVKPHEMFRLIRMTQTLVAASDIASELRFMRNGLTRDIVKEKVNQKTFANGPNDDCVDLVLELADPRRSSTNGGLYTELSCKTLSLGDRVRRGPNWTFGDQDSHLPGTVVGQNDLSLIWVRWDNGHRNVYSYDENERDFSVEKISNVRKVVDELVAVGCRVERGHDWTYGEEDGGRGCQGTVLNVTENGAVIVRWDCRKIALYRMGQDGMFEIKLSGDSNLTPNHISIPNRDLENEDDINANSYTVEDTKFDRYVIPVNSKTKVNDVWEFKDREEWKQFSREIQIRLQKYYSRNQHGRPLLEIESISYEIDFKRMKKINPKTKEEIELRRRSLSDSSAG